MAEDIAGIYCFRNSLSGRRYIGQSVNLPKRRRQHIEALRAGVHFNDRLQRAYNSYGSAVFVFEVLERCSAEYLTVREQFWIDHFAHGLYNLRPYADPSIKGYKHSPQSRAAMSAAHKGLPYPESKRLASIGKTRPRDVRVKISAALCARRWKPDTASKVSASIKAWHASKTVEQKIAFLAHMSKMRLKLVGRTQSPEEQARRSAALKEAWKRRKAA